VTLTVNTIMNFASEHLNSIS